MRLKTAVLQVRCMVNIAWFVRRKMVILIFLTHKVSKKTTAIMDLSSSYLKMSWSYMSGKEQMAAQAE